MTQHVGGDHGEWLTGALGASGRVVTASSLPVPPVQLLGPWGAPLRLLSRGTVAAVR